MRVFILTGLLALAALASPQPLAAQEGPIPERRLLLVEDVDFFGADLAQIFDTTLEACRAACLSDPDCRAFTFNTRSTACFPKSEAGRQEPFEGAVSGWVLEADPRVLAAAEGRREELDFLDPGDFAAAREQAQDMATRHVSAIRDEAQLLEAARGARAAGNDVRAAHFFGAAANLSGAADIWEEYARTLLEMEVAAAGERRDLRARALNAAINTYLRSGPAEQRATAATLLARALEEDGRGRDMIPALRLAQSLHPRDEAAALLDHAIGRYGFRVIDHRIDSEPAQPRICAVFSEDLDAARHDYAPFVRIDAPGVAVEAEGQQLCIEGVAHGEHHSLTLRAGLPAASGEELAESVTLDLYVRDRSPMVRFPGRGYVLPAAGPLALPVETVNTDEIELALRRVSDRNLLRSMQEEVFARPIPAWRDEQFTTDMAEAVWEGRAEVEMTLNRDMTSRLPLEEMAGRLEPGIYVLRAAVPGADPWEAPAAAQWFVVSDLGITSMQGTDGLHVVVRSLEDAGPKAGVEVELVSRANRVLGTAVTDERGHAMFAPGLARGRDGAAPALLSVREGDADMAFLSLTEPEFDLADRGVAGREAPPPVDVFLTTDRGAYRAGETVHVTALARDSQAAAIEGVPLTARLMRPDGVEYARERTVDAGAGGHVVSMPVAGSAPRGVWRLELFSDDADDPLASKTLLVEDFLPERIDFDLTLPEGPIRLGDVPELSIAARYLFGAPGGDLAIEGEVALRAAEELDGFAGFRFGRHDEPFSTAIEALPFGNRTDAEGDARLPLALPRVDDPARPLEMELRVRLSEGSGRPVERRLTRPVAPTDPVLGIRPLFDDVVPEGETARFQLVAVGARGEAVPARVKWRVNRVETRYQWYQLHGNWNWEPVTTRERVAEGEAELGGDDPAQIAAPVDWGRYEITVERIDGPFAAASTAFNAGWYATGDAIETPDMLETSLDREAYAPGDTAMLRVVPRNPGTALVSVMSNRLIDMQIVEVEEGENLIPLSVTDEWGAGAYVTASVLRPMDTDDGRNPARALGIAHADVDPGERRLTTRIDAPEEADPRGPLDVALRVDGLAEGEVAYATIAAVDLGILNLTGFEPPDPEGHYFGQRRLGVGLRDIYGRLIDASQGAMGIIRSGGDAGLSARLEAPPPTEELVAWFSGPLTVGPDGMARARLDLPAFNGTVRLMAVAWSGRAVGQAQADVLVRDPVVVNASLPRFMAPGDDSRLLLELTHAGGPAGRVGLEVTATPGVELGEMPGEVELAEGGRATVAVPLTALSGGVQEITVAITTPGGQVLTRPLMLPVERNDPEIARTTQLTLEPGQSFTLDANAFAGLSPGSGSATLSVGPLARFDAPGLLRMLDRYPYGCTEQVAAAAMPLLYMAELAEVMGLGHADDIDARIARAIGDVLNNQGSNGSFGLWFPSAGDLWLDAFTTDFLSRARALGHAVPEPAFRMAMDNLRNRINYAPDFDAEGAPYAYALMVLAREGAAAVGDLRYYADTRPDAFDTPLAAGQLGAALAAYGDQRRADAMFDRAARLMERGEPEGRPWRADYGSDLRDAAGLLTLALETGSMAVDRDALVRKLAGATGDRLSTQEATWKLLAAHALIDRPGTDGLTIDGQPVTGPPVRMTDADTLGDGEIAIRNEGSRAETLTLTTFGIPDEPEPAAANGYRIERRYFTMEGEPADPAQVRAGTRLVTILEVIPFEDRRARLMVNDPLPAGFEIDNPNLLRGGDVRALDGLDLLDSPEDTEFRQERFLAAVDWDSDSRFRLGYIVRAVSPGDFHHPAASVEDMYRPALRGRTAPGRVSVTE